MSRLEYSDDPEEIQKLKQHIDAAIVGQFAQHALELRAVGIL